MRILNFALTWYLFGTISLYSQVISSDEAVKIITGTRPFDFNSYAATTGGPAFLDKLRPLYNSQLQAIEVIGEHKLSNQVFNLIPYLDYTSNSQYVVIGRPWTPSPKLIRKAWPTYAAILELPDSTSSLKQYCLNKQNPINYRIGAFLVLRDVDKSTFMSVSQDFDAEFQTSNPSVKDYIKTIENGSAYFWGVKKFE